MSWGKIMIKSEFDQNRGQGLPEYALLISLISALLIVIVALFGNSLSNAYYDVIWSIEPTEIADPGGTNPVVDWQVQRIGFRGSKLHYRVKVSEPSTIIITDSQTGQSNTISCNRMCNGHFPDVGSDAGVVTIIGNGETTTIPYPPL
jgi:hypothetical protein